MVTSKEEDLSAKKSSIFAETNSKNSTTVIVPNAYVVQLEPNSGLTKRGQDAHSRFHKRASESIEYSVRHEFHDPSLFFGLSIQVKDNSNESSLLAISNVMAVWPVRIIPRPAAVSTPPTGVYDVDGIVYTATATAGSRAIFNSVHQMTDVDRVHELGIKGIVP